MVVIEKSFDFKGPNLHRMIVPSNPPPFLPHGTRRMRAVSRSLKVAETCLGLTAPLNIVLLGRSLRVTPSR
jgi:hypothetical protein